MQTDILKRIALAKSGTVFFVSDFADIGDEKAVSRILSALERKGHVARLAKGIYFKPKMGDFGLEYPSVMAIVNAVASRDRISILPSGLTAENQLGLSEQVPMRYEFLTSGSARVLDIGIGRVYLRRGVPRNFSFKSRLLATLVQALKSIGRGNVEEHEMSIIRNLMAQSDERDTIRKEASIAPKWIREIIIRTLDETEQYVAESK